MKNGRNRMRRGWEPWISVLIFILLLAAWEWLARTGRISTLFFPAPSRIAAGFVRMLKNGTLADSLLATLQRLFVGFVCGAVPGLFLGLAMGWSPRLRAIVDPFIAAVHPIPRLAVFPLIMIIFGIGESSKIIAIGISSFFPVLINSMTGVRELNPVYFEVARNYGASRWKTFPRINLPSTLPSVLSGIRIGINMAMVIAVAVELLSAQKGLGVLIWFAWQTFRIEDLYVSLFVTAFLGIVINILLHLITRKLVPWSHHSSESSF
jgi:ABC-type nitrate/sulfonate/bicarbonate transport system permease component